MASVALLKSQLTEANSESAESLSTAGKLLAEANAERLTDAAIDSLIDGWQNECFLSARRTNIFADMKKRIRAARGQTEPSAPIECCGVMVSSLTQRSVDIEVPCGNVMPCAEHPAQSARTWESGWCPNCRGPKLRTCSRELNCDDFPYPDPKEDLNYRHACPRRTTDSATTGTKERTS